MFVRSAATTYGVHSASASGVRRSLVRQSPIAKPWCRDGWGSAEILVPNTKGPREADRSLLGLPVVEGSSEQAADQLTRGDACRAGLGFNAPTQAAGNPEIPTLGPGVRGVVKPRQCIMRCTVQRMNSA